jgi:hypothetical protein
VQPLPLAGHLALEQRDGDAVGRDDAAAQVRDGDAHAHRALVRQSRHRHEPAHALRDLVEARPLGVRTVLAEAEMLG